MTTVFLYGKKSDKGLSRLLRTRFKKSYRVIYIGGGVYEESGEGYEITLIETDRLRYVDIPSAVIIPKEETVLGALPSGKAVYIINAANGTQVDALRGSGMTVITCGSEPTDTVSYTSIDGERIMSSLNLGITALSGKSIEPLEIPVAFGERPQSIYNLLAYTALRLILDDASEEIKNLK